jgi:uncharacterized protein (DUF1501 family)
VGTGPDAELRKSTLRALARKDSNNDDLAFLRRTSAAAFQAADRLEHISKDYRAGAEYPTNHLGRCLKSVAQMIVAEVGTEIFYVSLGGFDTHNQQQNVHATLLTELSTAVTAFIRDLQSHRLDDRVLLMTYSEFGRRVKENGSLGTDHGAASQMFVVRPKSAPGGKSGFIGKHPSLTDLDDGDLKHHTDFRSAYATVLDRWLKVDSRKVLGRSFGSVDFL